MIAGPTCLAVFARVYPDDAIVLQELDQELIFNDIAIVTLESGMNLARACTICLAGNDAEYSVREPTDFSVGEKELCLACVKCAADVWGAWGAHLVR